MDVRRGKLLVATFGAGFAVFGATLKVLGGLTVAGAAARTAAPHRAAMALVGVHRGRGPRRVLTPSLLAVIIVPHSGVRSRICGP